jgi:hypothetical protein
MCLEVGNCAAGSKFEMPQSSTRDWSKKKDTLLGTLLENHSDRKSQNIRHLEAILWTLLFTR